MFGQIDPSCVVTPCALQENNEISEENDEFVFNPEGGEIFYSETSVSVYKPAGVNSGHKV
jgi:hypothetical protein